MSKIYNIFFSIITFLSILIPNFSWGQCQEITASVTTSPAYGEDTIVRICQNQSVTFMGTATFAEFDEGATYDWKFNNVGGYSTSTTFTYTFTAGGVYVVDFVPMDSTGCVSKDCNSRVIVYVSADPSFWGSAVPDSICQGVPVSVSADGIGSGEVTTTITPDTPTYECAPPISDTTFLPDGSGASYSTSIEVTCFTACDTIIDGSDILDICLIMEHSFLGDLDWTITCPSGEEVTLKEYPGGGGTYLGGAIDDASTDPGIGAEYCFSDDATWDDMLTELAAGTTVMAGSPLSASMAPGTYKPKESFDNLIGCPLNGTWTITVTDHLWIDNGYIFGWGINFNTGASSSYSFYSEIESFMWTGPDIIEEGPPTVLIPQEPGTQCYTLTAIDDFGCAYDTTLCTFVKEFPNPGADTTFSICPSAGSINLFEYLGGTPELGGFWTGTGVTSTGVLNTAALAPGYYEYDYNVSNTFCDTVSTISLFLENDFEIDFNFEIFNGCSNDTVIFKASSEDTIAYFRWNFGDGSTQDTTNFTATHIYEEQDEYEVWFVAINNNGCIDSIMRMVSILHPLDAAFTQSSDSICQEGANTVSFTDGSIGNIQAWEWDFGDGNTSFVQNPVHSYTLSGEQTVRLIVTDHIPCSDTFYSTVFVDSVATIEMTVDKEEICAGDKVNFSVEYFYSTLDLHWDFGDGSLMNGIHTSFAHNYPGPGTYYISVTSDHPVCESITAVDTVTVKPYPQINLGSDTQLCLKGAPVFMDPTVLVNNPAGTIYYWSSGDTSKVLKITEPGSYWVSANLDGCITTDEFEVNKDCYTDIPNSFTPNGDGSNDYFYPRQLLSEGVIDFKMTIFNRWGEVVFETANPDGRGWDGKFDGKDQPMGVYVYQISVRYKNQAAEKYTGNVTLLR